MLSFIDPLFWIYFLYFIVSIFIAFYIPGSILLTIFGINLNNFQKFVLGTVIGAVAWGWQGVIFGYLGLRDLSYVYLLILVIVWVKMFVNRDKLNHLKIQDIRIDKNTWLIIILIAVGTLVQISTVWFTGSLSSNGLYFCCGNESDLLFHASLTKQIIDHFPPYQPGMYGQLVQNYHYWSNILFAELIRVFHLPLMATQFQYSSVFISLFLGLSALVFAQMLKVKKAFSAWLLFFLYFGGDWAYFASFILGNGLNFNLSSMEDGARFLTNPPRALSIVILFTGLALFLQWIKKRDSKSGILTMVILGSLIGFKVYTGIFALIGLATLGLYFLITKNFRMAFILLIMPIVSFLIYIPVNKDAGGLYFTGLWIFRDFIVNKDLGMVRWEQARLIFLEHKNWLRVVQYESMFAVIFIFSIFGSKLFGLFQTKKSLSLFPRELHIFLLSGLIVSLITGLFFQQTSGGANTFNFLVSVYIFGSIYTALACFYFTQKTNNKVALLIILLVILITIPRVTREAIANMHRLSIQEGFKMSNEELEAYRFIREKTRIDATLLVDDSELYLSNKSPFISLMTDRKVYLSGDEILISHGIDISSREKQSELALKSESLITIAKFLSKNNINYVIVSSKKNLPINDMKIFLEPIFSNEKIKILEYK